jgi:hypothetical protein
MPSTRELRWIAFFLLATTGSSFSTTSRTVRRQNTVVHPLRSSGPLPGLLNSRFDEDKNEMPVEDRSLVEAAIIYSFPVITAANSFTFYEQISKAFHDYVQVRKTSLFANDRFIILVFERNGYIPFSEYRSSLKTVGFQWMVVSLS